MSRPPSRIPQAGFTFVELLLALALAGLVAAILGLLVRGLFFAGEGQSVRLNSSHAARAALRILAREVSCAFAPPVENLPPLKLSATTEPGKPQVALSFYAPVPAPLGYDMDQVTYEVMANRRGPSELLRISAPCSGPHTNAPVTNLLFSGRFSLAIQAINIHAPLHPRASRQGRRHSAGDRGGLLRVLVDAAWLPRRGDRLCDRPSCDFRSGASPAPRFTRAARPSR